MIRIYRGMVPSTLFNHFGHTSVAFFFMITALLFFSKLRDAQGRTLDWLNLYLSRLFRIMPLYLFALTCVLLLVAITSNFGLNESVPQLTYNISRWLLFMKPDINQYKGTSYLLSGVQWSLAFEWLFYCSLAIFGTFLFKIKPSTPIFLLACFGVIIFALVIYQTYLFLAWKRISTFLGGVAAAFLVKDEKVVATLRKSWVTVGLVILLYITFFLYKDIFSPIPYLCPCTVFIAIACGNNLFGLLTLKAARLLGEISYSIYLMHGLLLFTTFHFIVENQYAEKTSPLIYWGIIACTSAVLIVLGFLTYYLIEKPFLNKAIKWTGRVRLYLSKQSRDTNNNVPLHP